MRYMQCSNDSCVAHSVLCVVHSFLSGLHTLCEAAHRTIAKEKPYNARALLALNLDSL